MKVSVSTLIRCSGRRESAFSLFFVLCLDIKDHFLSKFCFLISLCEYFCFISAFFRLRTNGKLRTSFVCVTANTLRPYGELDHFFHFSESFKIKSLPFPSDLSKQIEFETSKDGSLDVFTTHFLYDVPKFVDFPRVEPSFIFLCFRFLNLCIGTESIDFPPDALFCGKRKRLRTEV